MLKIKGFKNLALVYNDKMALYEFVRLFSKEN